MSTLTLTVDISTNLNSGRKFWKYLIKIWLRFAPFQVHLQSILLKVHRQDSELPALVQNGQIDENTEPSSKRRKQQNENSDDAGGMIVSNGVITPSFPVLTSELKIIDKNIK